jgi:hypothetical protein
MFDAKERGDTLELGQSQKVTPEASGRMSKN